MKGLGKLWRYLFFRSIQAYQEGARCGRSIWRRVEFPAFNSSVTLSWKKGLVRQKWRCQRPWYYRQRGTFAGSYGCLYDQLALCLWDARSSQRTGWSQHESMTRALQRGHLQDNKHERFQALSYMDLLFWPPYARQCCLLAAPTLIWSEEEHVQSKGQQGYSDLGM